MKYILCVIMALVTISAMAGKLTTYDIHDFDTLPEPTKAQAIADIAKLVNQQQSTQGSVTADGSVSVIQEAAAGVNMTPDQLIASPVGASAVQYVAQKRHDRTIMRQLLGSSFLAITTIIWLYILRRGILLKSVTHKSFQVNDKIVIKKDYQYRDADGGGLTLMFIGGFILIAIGILIIFV